jgi:hypothetical protein
MKFYKYNDFNQLLKLVNNKFPFIYNYTKFYTAFYNDGAFHNIKNASYIQFDGIKYFCLNGILYGAQYGAQSDYTKESWRRFTKLKAFL